ncbi:MAG: carbonic anhydrase [Verrucomicrobiales bacterium]|jgi:carbonic anhydrase
MKTTTALIISTAIASLASVSCVTTGGLPPTFAEQKALTPDTVISDLMAGNKRYMKGNLSNPNVTKRIAATSTGQYPKAVILSCLDSRVPVEQVFDQGVGDIFVGRVAGNIENGDQLGSMEFATKVAGAKLVMVLGHESCGAVKSACDHVKVGNITGLLSNITPAVNSVSGIPASQRNSKNADFVEKVVEANVEKTVADIRSRSKILRDLEKSGDIKIVGGVYSISDGSVTLLD